MESGQTTGETGPTVRAPPTIAPTPELAERGSSSTASDDNDTLVDREELKLPPISSIVIVVVANLLLQVRSHKRLKKNLP